MGGLFPPVCRFGGGVAVDDELLIGVLAVVVVIGHGLGVVGRSGTVRAVVVGFVTVVFNRFESASGVRGGIRVNVVVCVVAVGMRMASGGGAGSPSRFLRATNFGLTDSGFPLPSDVDDGPGIPVTLGRAAASGSH